MYDGFNTDCCEQGEELKKMIGAVTYIECSSKTQQVNTLTSLDSTILSHILKWIQAVYWDEVKENIVSKV